MAANIFTMEAVNLFCGDHDANETQPGSSTHLTIREMKLPAIEENHVDHVAGGAIAGIEVFTHMQKLEATFTLVGMQREVMGLIARSARAAQRFTCRGIIRDQRRGSALMAVAIIQGRLGRVNPTAFRRGDMHEHEYAIKGIVAYELAMEDEGATVGAGGDQSPAGHMTTIYEWDFFLNKLVVNGYDVMAEENAILGLSAADTTPEPLGPQ